MSGIPIAQGIMRAYVRRTEHGQLEPFVRNAASTIYDDE